MPSDLENQRNLPEPHKLSESDGLSVDQKILGLALRRAFDVSDDEPMSPRLQEAIEKLIQAGKAAEKRSV